MFFSGCLRDFSHLQLLENQYLVVFQAGNRLGWLFHNHNLIDFRGLVGGWRGTVAVISFFFLLLLLCRVLGFGLGIFVWVVVLVWEGFGFWRVSYFICLSCFVFSKCTICLLARWGNNAGRQSWLPPTAAATRCHAAVQNVKAEAALFLSMPQIQTPSCSILMQAVCGPVWGLAVQESPVLSSFLHLEGRCGCITAWLLGLSLPQRWGALTHRACASVLFDT